MRRPKQLRRALGAGAEAEIRFERITVFMSLLWSITLSATDLVSASTSMIISFIWPPKCPRADLGRMAHAVDLDPARLLQSSTVGLGPLGRIADLVQDAVQQIDEGAGKAAHRGHDAVALVADRALHVAGLAHHVGDDRRSRWPRSSPDAASGPR